MSQVFQFKFKCYIKQYIFFVIVITDRIGQLMQTFNLGHLSIAVNKEGAGNYSKVSYPIRYGRYHEINTPKYTFQYNLNGEIKFIQGRERDWPHPAEWLKRTILNDWVYYSTGGYTGAYNFIGEHYLPNLSYASNAVLGGAPFKLPQVQKALTAWQGVAADIRRQPAGNTPPDVAAFINRLTANDPRTLQLKALRHMAIIEGRISVLPPDSRHVDYELIPVIIADGCLHNCGFCRIKTRRDFAQRASENILMQIEKLKGFYGEDLENYNALFLGLHDGLNSDPERILFAADNAFNRLKLHQSRLQPPRLFLFGSAQSLLRADPDLFASLSRLPYHTSINIGLESADSQTLSLIRKPTSPSDVVAAFEKMVQINRSYTDIEVTANFIISDHLPSAHYATMLELIRNRFDHPYSKGSIYLSPYDVTDKSRVLQIFNEMKMLSRLPLYLYLIQRI